MPSTFDRDRGIAHSDESAVASRLTVRERQVLGWAAAGKSSWETGMILGIGKRTVDEHAQTAMRKLGAVTRIQAVAIAIRTGELTESGENASVLQPPPTTKPENPYELAVKQLIRQKAAARRSARR
ncbi:MAG TPA: helix-turn-helix transcriptional regulator, partial [Xanthobacteraceae bacterium]